MYIYSLAGDVEKWPEPVLFLRPYVECKQKQDCLIQAYQRNGYVDSFQISWNDFVNEWELLPKQ